MILVLNIIGQILQAIGILAILAATYTYLVYRRQLNFDVITKCADRFRAVMDEIESPDPFERRKAQRRYVDLCNEQLFYCGAGYLPDVVIDEWLDGMIDYLPQLKEYEVPENETGSTIKKPVPHEENFSKKRAVDINLLLEYPRIMQAFLVDNNGGQPFDLDKEEDRRKLIKHVNSKLDRQEGLLESLEDRLKNVGQSLNRSLQPKDQRGQGGNPRSSG